MAMRRVLTTLGPKRLWAAEKAFQTTSSRLFGGTTQLSDLASFYTIEISNTARPDATKIIVRGPDVDGILASMTVALAQEGCSLKELHAGYANVAETNMQIKHVEGDLIEDIFYVSKHKTGNQFEDGELEDIGKALLSALNTPMRCLSGKSETPMALGKNPDVSKDSQIIVIKKGE
jgi:hypothetical protein